jgi:hypothetical protein
MSIRVDMINRLMLTVEIRMLREHRIPREEPAHRRIIVPRSHMHQAGIAISAIAPCGCEHVGVGAAAGGAYGLAKSVITNGAEDGLAGVGDSALRTQAVKEGILPVLANEGIAVGIGSLSLTVLRLHHL